MWWLAQVANPAPKTQMGDFLIPALWLVGGLIVAAGILVAVRKWGRQAATPDEDVHQQLAQFRQAYQQGQMNRGEYERVHALLAEKIRQQTGVAPPPADPLPHPMPKPPRETADFEPDGPNNDGQPGPQD